MVGGRYISSGLAGALAQAGKGYLGGKLQGIANENQQSQSNALTQALMGDNPQQSLAGLSDNPMAQQYAQQLALKRAESGMTPQTKLIRGEEIGAPQGSVYQLTKDGYKEVYAPKSVELPESVQTYLYGKQDPEFKRHQLEQKKAGGVNISNVVGGKGDPLTPAQEAIDKKFGEEIYYPAFVKGGLADSQAQIKTLGKVKKDLENDDNLSGPFIGALPESVRSIVAPESINAQQLVEQTVQRSLKDILGGQFAQQEAKELFRRTYNPSLDEKYNMERVKNLIGVLENAEANKRKANEYYQEKGTLRGFEGQVPTIESIISDFEKQSNEGQTFSVSAPNGKRYSFGSQEALNQFKQKAGIK